MRQGTLQGTVYSEGMRSRVANAVVKLRNLNTQKEYESQPTDAKGNYKILMIDEGWYTLGVTTAVGDFNLNYGVYIKAGETAKLSVEMQPGGMLEGKGGNGNGGKKGFFAKPEGVLVLVAGAGAVALRHLRADQRSLSRPLTPFDRRSRGPDRRAKPESS